MADTWITGAAATAILSERAGRPISDAYIRLLCSENRTTKAGKPIEPKIRRKRVDGRTWLYHRGDCEAYTVHPKRGQRVSERVRDQRTGRPAGRPRKTPATQTAGN